MTLLAVDTKAPDFNLKDQSGQDVSLESLRGKWAVIYFYASELRYPGMHEGSVQFPRQLRCPEGCRA